MNVHAQCSNGSRLRHAHHHRSASCVSKKRSQECHDIFLKLPPTRGTRAHHSSRNREGTNGAPPSVAFRTVVCCCSSCIDPDHCSILQITVKLADMTLVSDFCSQNQRRQRRKPICARRVLVTLLLVVVAGKCSAFTRPTLLTSKTAQSCTCRLVYETMSMLKASESNVSPTATCFLHRDPPYLAVITEPNACDSAERVNATINAVSSAVSTDKVALVSVRVVKPNHVSHDEFEKRVVDLTSKLVAMSLKHSFHVVVSSDWVDAAIQSGSHGIHVKEHHQPRIPEIQTRFAPRVPLIGTSAHSVSSALEAASLYHPDYFFVGTCYATESHPEKVDLEGPTLPGKVCRALEEQEGETKPVVLAIGGIDEENCAKPAREYGADGVAAIRSVLQSTDPAISVENMIRNMQKGGG